MDDLEYGTRNKPGDWSPSQPVEYTPLFLLPPKPAALLKWLPHYLLSWDLLPLDKGFGTWHDDSPEGEARMQARYRQRKERTREARTARIAATGKVARQ